MNSIWKKLLAGTTLMRLHWIASRTQRFRLCIWMSAATILLLVVPLHAEYEVWYGDYSYNNYERYFSNYYLTYDNRYVSAGKGDGTKLFELSAPPPRHIVLVTANDLAYVDCVAGYTGTNRIAEETYPRAQWIRTSNVHEYWRIKDEPDGKYAVMRRGRTGGAYTSFMMLTNSGNWTAIKVYATPSTNLCLEIEATESETAAKMSVPTIEGVSYRLQHCNNLASSQWVNDPPTYRGTGEQVGLYAALGSDPSRFYRTTATSIADPGESIANMASRIIESINDTSQTDYRYSTYINESENLYRTDCSGFVSYLIGQCSPIHLDFIPRERGYPVPRAFKYYDFFDTVNTADLGITSVAWKPITHVQYIKRGDVLVWRNPNWPNAGSNSGHVMIVAEAATHTSSNEWTVLVYDSSSVTHFSPDSRTSIGTKGVGSGIIKLWVDGENIPVNHQLGPGTPFSDWPIAMGRPQALW